MVPNHGDHCGPGHESEGPPKSDTDAACMRHDRCYGEAFTREEELLCDQEACNEIAHVVADDLGEHLYKEGMKMAFCNQPYSLAMEDKQMTQVPRQWGQPRKRYDRVLKTEVEVKEQRGPNKRLTRRERAAEGVKAAEALLDEFEAELTSAPREQFVQADGKKVGPATPPKGKAYRKKLNRVKNAKKKAKRRFNRQKRNAPVFRKNVKKRLKRAGVRPTVGVSEFAHKIEQDWNIQPMRGKGRRSDGIILTGSDLLDVVSSGGTGPAVGATTYTVPLAPSDSGWATTRLAQFVPLFQRYKFLDVEFVWEPACGTTTAGQGIHFIDYDVDVTGEITPITGTLNAVKVAAAKKRNKPFRYWEENVARYAPDGEIQTLFLEPGVAGSDPRLYSQGRYFLIVASPPPINTSLGILYVRYKIQLWDASLTIPAPDPPMTPSAFVWRYAFDMLPKEVAIESAEKVIVWLADLGELAPTFTNMTGVTVTSDLDTGIITFENLPEGYTTIDAGIKFMADSVNDDIFTGGFPGSAIVPSETIVSADWVRLDCDDTSWRASQFDNGASAAFGQESNLSPGALERAVVQVYGRSHFEHNVQSSVFKLFCGQAIGVECDTGEYHFTTWIDVVVIPPAARKPCPHEIRARPLGKGFKSDLYVWNPESKCSHQCDYCDRKMIEYEPEEIRRQKVKEARQAEKAKERDTLGEVMLYLLERTKRADEKEKCAKDILAPLSKKEEVDPDRGVLEGLMKLPKPIQPKAMLVMAHCPCSCGKKECDICGCHELSGCESGMRIPRADSAEYLELKKFWMTVLSNLNDDKSLCDLAKRQGAYRSIRAFLCSEATRGEKL